MKRETFVALGLGIAMVIAILAPFLASPNPDGLESAAEKFSSAEGKDYLAFNSPLPDYIVPSLGEGESSGVVAIVFGTIGIFVLSYLFIRAIRTKQSCTL